MRENIFKLSSLILSTSGLAFFASAAAAQEVTLFIPTATIVDYDPFEGLAGLREVNLEAGYYGEAPISVRLIITPDTHGDFRFIGSGEPLEFEIISTYGRSDINRFDVPVTLVPSGALQTIPLTFKIPPGQYADYGDVEIDLKIELVDSITSEALSDEKFLTLVRRTPMRAQTNFAGASAGYENGTTYAVVNFGEINRGDSRNINFQVRGNTNVDIIMSSENNGKMINISAPDTLPINYSVTADGIQSDLSTPLEFTRRPNKTLNGSSYPLVITLDAMETGAFAGQYRDIISIDVTPR